MFKPLDQELMRIRSSGQERRLPYSRSRGFGRVDVAGKSLIDFTSFDYLGLSNNKRVIKVAQQALESHGISQSSSRTSAGTLPEVFSAEQRLAKLLGAESALFFSSRNQALLSLMSALVSEGDLVAFDEAAQAPLTDACHLLDVVPASFNQNRPDSLDPVLLKSPIVPVCLYADGLSAITGEVFPLEVLAKKITLDKKVHLVMDESYSLGVVGDRGSGAFEQAAVILPHVSFIGTFGFGCPGFGGYVAGKAVLIDYIKQNSRAFDVECPIPVNLAAATEEGINVLELEILTRRRICEQAFRFRQHLLAADIEVSGGLQSPIVSVFVNSFKSARDIVARIETKGFLVDFVGLRTIRKECPLLRVVFNANHKQTDIDLLLGLIIESVGRSA
jgi:7-keto-8-aminopelargonate synthetase-like enzyme